MKQQDFIRRMNDFANSVTVLVLSARAGDDWTTWNCANRLAIKYGAALEGREEGKTKWNKTTSN